MTPSPRIPVILAVVAGACAAVAGPSAVAAPAAPKPGWSPPEVLAPAGPSYTRVSVAVSRRGDAAVAWIQEATCCSSDGTGRLVVRHRQRGGGTFSRPRVLAPSDARLPVAAVSQRSEPMVAWVAGSSIRVAVQERGEPWRTWNVTSKVSDVVALRAAIDVSGRMNVVWVQQADAGDATVRSASALLAGADTAPWSVDPPLEVPNGPVSIAVASRGTGLAVWPRDDGSIDYSLRAPAGDWSQAGRLAPPDSAVPAATVRIDIAPLGQAVAAWFDDAATRVRASLLADPVSPSWETPVTLTTAAPGLFSNLAVSIDNGAAVSWAGACAKSGRQPVGVAHRPRVSAPWRTVPSPPVLSCDGEDRSIVQRLGIVRGPRIVLLAPVEVGVGPDVAFGAQATLRGTWQRGALPGDQSVAEMYAAGRVGLFTWSRPEDGTALRWRQYVAP